MTNLWWFYGAQTLLRNIRRGPCQLEKCLSNIWKVRPRCQAFPFPYPAKKDVVLHPVRACKMGTHFDFDGPRPFAKRCVSRILWFFLVPQDTHNSFRSKVATTSATTSVSVDRVMTDWYMSHHSCVYLFMRTGWQFIPSCRRWKAEYLFSSCNWFACPRSLFSRPALTRIWTAPSCCYLNVRILANFGVP